MSEEIDDIIGGLIVYYQEKYWNDWFSPIKNDLQLDISKNVIRGSKNSNLPTLTSIIMSEVSYNIIDEIMQWCKENQENLTYLNLSKEWYEAIDLSNAEYEKK